MAPSTAQATAQAWEEKSGFDEFIQQDYKDFMSKGGKRKNPQKKLIELGASQKKLNNACKEVHAEIQKRDMKGLKCNGMLCKLCRRWMCRWRGRTPGWSYTLADFLIDGITKDQLLNDIMDKCVQRKELDGINLGTVMVTLSSTDTWSKFCVNYQKG
ncbi:hypothetical protein KC363_g9124 [Hortaea werneckii]|nr:hypothetical protein KC363_g9124 [Hortaea werneckii]